MTAPTNEARDVAERLERALDDALEACSMSEPLLIDTDPIEEAIAEIRALRSERDQMAARIAELLGIVTAGERVEGWVWPSAVVEYRKIVAARRALGCGLELWSAQEGDAIPATLILRRPSSDSSSTEHNPAADPGRAEESET